MTPYEKLHPVSASDWDYCTIKELSAALESRQISASELLERTVARIEALDSRLNAVVVRDFERAREAARAADIALAKGERRALLGIPLGRGSVQCCRLADDLGLSGVQGFVAKEDALIISRTKRAGAVLLGKTNVPLGLGDFQSYNDIYGTTNNPWDGGLQAVPLLLWQPALGHCRSDRISAGRCACRRRMPTMR